jgi:hypothetical protein
MADVLFQTRFSFFGRSGWRSKASKTPEMLFDPDRLDPRLEMFEKITPASLKCQDDPDFHLVVLSSTLMPEVYQKKLTEMCNDNLGPERSNVIFRPKAHAPAMFKDYVHSAYEEEQILAQVVLDDDDAVCCDFVSVVKAETEAALRPCYDEDVDTVFISFARGISLILGDGEPEIAPRNSIFNNQGLIMAAPAGTRRNPYNTSHRMIHQRRPSRSIATKPPFYLRTLHDSNDSRGLVDDVRLTQDEIKEMARYFPFLPNLMRQKIRLSAA